MQNTTFFVADGRRKNNFACDAKQQSSKAAKQLLALATSLKRLHDKQLLLGNYAFCMAYVVVCYQRQISRNGFGL